MFKTHIKEAAFAVEAVTAAAQLCRQIQHDLVLPAVSKADKSPVTVADFAAQAVVAQMLNAAFPHMPLVAEEDSALLREPDQSQTLERVQQYVARLYPRATSSQIMDWIDRGSGEPEGSFWTLDPIDGTKGFIRGDQYVVALALIIDGKVAVGAMGCPNLDVSMRPDHDGPGSVAIAVRNEAAWAMSMAGGEWSRLKVSDCDAPDCARMLRSYESSHTDPGKIDQISHELGLKRAPILMDSSAKYGLLAAGEGELIVRLLSPLHPEYIENLWDHATGALLIEEAGGRITDLQGKKLDFSRGRKLMGNIGVLTSNGHLHASVLRAIAQVGANRRPEHE